MFGGKLKTWMETHIGRQKKRPGGKEKKKPDKILVESSESLAQSDTGISSGSLQVLSSVADGQDSYCTTTIESENRGVTHGRTVNLSSPESAYSTGYSTDGASGDALNPHPEYYINIRSGKHYFPSPAPTPTSPNPHPRACITTSFLSAEPRIPPLQTFPSWLTDSADYSVIPEPNTCDALKPAKRVPPKSPLSSLKLFLKSPKQDKVKPKVDSRKSLSPECKKSPYKSKKWYQQPFKFGHKSSDSENKVEEHRANTLDVVHTAQNDELAGPNKGGLVFSGDPSSSPRQRNRIRTNPWIATEPLSAHNFQRLQLTFPNGLRNRSCTNTPLQQRKTPDEPPLQNKLDEMTVKYETSRDYLVTLEKAVNIHVSQKCFIEVSDHSEEDLTLNEMMGTYNESYVYDKETDILSDSDPTDCEDYISDSEAIHGGDEDSHDDELDFIDTGSTIESDEVRPNTGRCSFHDIPPPSKNVFLYKNRCKNNLHSENRKNSRKEKEAKKRRREEKHRKSLRKLEKEDIGAVKNTEHYHGNVSLRNVLLKRMMDKTCSRSAESSPVGLRRKHLVTDLRETHIGSRKVKNSYDIAFLTEAEADKKYTELIQEAENMLESLKNTPVAHRRAHIEPQITPNACPSRNLSPRRSSPNFDARKETPRKSPKHLGLKLAIGKKAEESDRKSSFRAKSSAHSPLDPLGPTFRNFSVFKECSPAKKISSSSSDDNLEMAPVRREPPRRQPTPPQLPFGFQFVDLGQSVASHCPQSEPVKRKMYSCSKTYDLLMRTFDGSQVTPTRQAVPAFYNPMYSPVPRVKAAPLQTSHLGRRLSEN